MKLEFQASYVISDLGELNLSVSEMGGNNFDVIVSSGEWFLSETGATADGDFADLIADVGSLLAEVESQLNAGGAAGGTYTVSFAATTKRVIIAHDGGGGVSAFSITPVELGGLLGLTGSLSGSIIYEGHRVPDYWIDADAGFWSDWSGEYEGGGDVAYDVEAHDGTPGGAAKEDAAIHLDFRVPLEPVAKVGNYPRLIETSAPWTWAHFWRHCRNTQAFTMRDDDEVYYLLMRAEGAQFRPRSLGDNYIARWDLDFQTRVLARGS